MATSHVPRVAEALPQTDSPSTPASVARLEEARPKPQRLLGQLEPVEDLLSQEEREPVGPAKLTWGMAHLHLKGRPRIPGHR